jgi:hypothetical protein
VRESKSGKNHRFAKFTGVLAIETDEFAEGHGGSAASGFGAYAKSPVAECTAACKRREAIRIETESAASSAVERLAVDALFGKMLERIRMRREERI